jgi:hypothetical protein
MTGSLTLDYSKDRLVVRSNMSLKHLLTIQLYVGYPTPTLKLHYTHTPQVFTISMAVLGEVLQEEKEGQSKHSQSKEEKRLLQMHATETWEYACRCFLPLQLQPL